MNDKVKILVVEDETSVAMMLVYLLARAGCEVQAASTADKALRLAETESFDLVTLDIDLPGASGFEVLVQMQQLSRWQDTPVVFVSARPFEEDMQLARELGAVDYIEKPFDARKFASRILGHIQRQPEFS